MNFLTVDEVVSAASTVTGGVPTREERRIFAMWTYIAEKQIESFKLNTKTDELTVINLVANKPEDHVRTQEIALIDSKGNDIRYKYRGYNNARIHPRTDVNNPRMIDIYEDNTCFHLGSEGCDIECVHVKYSAMPLDDSGELMIPESHLYPIMMFIKYMNELRKGSSISSVEVAKQEWKVQASKARGKDNMPSIPEFREILLKWQTLIPKGLNEKYSTY